MEQRLNFVASVSVIPSNQKRHCNFCKDAVSFADEYKLECNVEKSPHDYYSSLCLSWAQENRLDREIHIQQTHILHITDIPTLHSSICMQIFMNPAGFIYARIHDIRSHTKHYSHIDTHTFAHEKKE